MADEMGETPRKRCTRQAGVRCELAQCPWMCRPIVEQDQDFADRRIAQSRKPAGLVIRQALQVSAHYLDKDQLAQSQPDRSSANPWLARLGKCEIDEMAQEALVAVRRPLDPQESWQRR